VIPQDFLKAVAAEHGVSESELEVLSRALAGETITAIATNLEIRAEAVRKRLGEVYKKFHIAGAGPGKMAKLQQILVTQYQDHQVLMVTQTSGDDLALLMEDTTKPRQDWGEAPDVSIFYGRTEELATLEDWISSQECRVVAVFGMAGIGKTALSVKLAHQLKDNFDYLIWRSLRHAPSLKDLLDNLLKFLYRRPFNYPLTEINDKISQLIAYLRKYRCLLVLDSAETILLPGELAGQYAPGYQDYGEFFRRLGEEPHKSCLLITSQEKPKEIALLEGKTMPGRSLPLQDLQTPDARKIFPEKSLSSPERWDSLISLYRGNPLALKIVATTISDLFGGQVAEFLKQNTLVFGDISGLVASQCDRLSLLEKEILQWLAIERQPASLAKLRENMILPVSQRELLEAVASLGQRSLIEKHPDREEAVFSLQPLLMEYVTTQIIDQVSAEIREVFRTKKTEKLVLLRSHVLVQPQAPAAIKANQISDILTPIQDRLRRTFRSESRITEYLTQIETLLQGEPELEVGYAAHNVQLLLGGERV
jgi:DNA-binding CsgD family transcriptional regulator